jgi:hypothetical protein
MEEKKTKDKGTARPKDETKTEENKDKAPILPMDTPSPIPIPPVVPPVAPTGSAP